MKKKSGVILIIFVLIAGAILYTFGVRPVYSYVPDAYSESTDPLNNPYEGMYRIYAYTLGDKSNTVTPDYISQSLAGDGLRLSLLEINLKNFAAGAISEEALSDLDDILAAFDESDHSVILRLLYDWDGHARDTEPKKLSIVKDHIIALAPVINAHAGCIYIMQGVLLGDYGEMHDSNLLRDDTMGELLSLLFSYMNNDIYMSVRTPAQWRRITKVKDTYFSNELSERLGMFNDGMLGSDTDLGTYERPRLQEQEFLGGVGMRTPIGGEVVIDNEYNDYELAREALALTMVSYLNMDYDAAVLDKWKASTETRDVAWSGKSGYDYIANHMGYRYYVSGSQLQDEGSLLSQDLTLRVTIKNTGFSPAYRPFSGYIRLIPLGEKAGDEITLDLPESIDSIQPRITSTMDIPIPDNKLENTDYEVRFYIKDNNTKENILLSNSGLVDGQLPLGTISCRSLLKK